MPRKPLPPAPGGPPLPFWAGLVLLAAVVALLWAPGQKGFFALDDFLFLEAYSPGAPRASPARWLTSVGPVDNAYRPLTTAAYFSAARRIFGLEPSGYHMASLALHGLTTLLVAGLCWALTRNTAAALLGGLFYGSRASLWVAVRWTSGVQELGLALGAALAALGVGLYVRRGRPLGLAACLGGVLVALGSKEASLVLVPALLAVAVAAAPGRWARRATRALGPALVASAAYLAWRVALTWRYPTIHRPSTSPAHIAERLARFILWCFSGLPGPSGPVGVALILGGAGLCLLALMRLASRSTAAGRPPPAWVRSLAAGCVFFGVALVPPLVITQVAHQYYLAMPLVGLSLAVAGASAGLLRAAERRSTLAVAALVVVLAGGMAASGLVEVRAKDAGRLASGGFYKAGDGQIYETALRGVSGLWPEMPAGATLLIVGYPYDGLISSDIRGGGLRGTSTMASMFRVFYGRGDLTVAHVVPLAVKAGTLSPPEARRRIEADPERTRVARFREGRFEALSKGEALSALEAMEREAGG